MASNMDGVGTFAMADALADLGLFTCLVKNYEAGELIDFFNADRPARRANVACSTGITESDFDKLEAVLARDGASPGIPRHHEHAGQPACRGQR